MKSKVAAAVLVGSALTLGAGSAAFAFPLSGGPGAASSTAVQRPACARAPKVLSRLERVDDRIATVLPKLQAAEQKATAAGHTTRADRIEKMISRLEQRKDKVTARIGKIEGRCPGNASGTGSLSAAVGSATTV